MSLREKEDRNSPNMYDIEEVWETFAKEGYLTPDAMLTLLVNSPMSP